MTAYARQQLLTIEGLSNEIDGAESKPLYPLFQISRRADEHNRNINGVSPFAFRRLASSSLLDPRHADVEKNEFGSFRGDRQQHEMRAVSRPHHEAFFCQDLRQELQVGRGVVNDKNGAWFGHDPAFTPVEWQSALADSSAFSIRPNPSPALKLVSTGGRSPDLVLNSGR